MRTRATSAGSSPGLTTTTGRLLDRRRAGALSSTILVCADSFHQTQAQALIVPARRDAQLQRGSHLLLPSHPALLTRCHQVEEARKAAAAKIAQENPAIDADDVDPLKLVQPNRAAAPPGGPRGAHVNHGFLPGNFDHNAHFAALQQAQQAALNAMVAAGQWGAGGFGGLFGGGYGGYGGGAVPNPPLPQAGPAPRAYAQRAPAVAPPARRQPPAPAPRLYTPPPAARGGQALGGPGPPAAPVVQQPTPAQLRARAAAAAERRFMKKE